MNVVVAGPTTVGAGPPRGDMHIQCGSNKVKEVGRPSGSKRSKLGQVERNAAVLICCRVRFVLTGRASCVILPLARRYAGEVPTDPSPNARGGSRPLSHW